MNPGTALIIGAGLGGLTAALALQRSGWRVRVHEQAAVLGEVGAGISVSPGSGRGLARLGLGPALLAASLPLPDVAFAHYRSGALLAGQFDHGTPRDQGFATARHIHRADLHRILLDAVQATDANAVLTGQRAQHVELQARGALVHFADGSHAQADLLVAADGTRSMVRRACFDDTPPEYAGQMAYRCLVPAERAAPFMGAGNAVVSIGPRRIFHRYRIRHGTLVNVIGIAQSESWQQEGWNTPASSEEFAAAYSDFHADVLGLIHAAPAHSLIKWGLFVRPPLASWQRGHVALLGDAAHPILPFLGLGAALAIEDGIVLARALDQASDVHSALAAYQASRVERVEQVRTQTLRQGQVIQSQDPDRADLQSAPAQDVNLFDYDPCTAPIVT